MAEQSYLKFTKASLTYPQPFGMLFLSPHSLIIIVIIIIIIIIVIF